MTPEILAKLRCVPPGSVDTALDVELDRLGNPRRCGMCCRDASDSTLGDVCLYCDHRFGWFQLLDAVGAVGQSPATEAALAKYIRAYEARRRRTAADE